MVNVFVISPVRRANEDHRRFLRNYRDIWDSPEGGCNLYIPMFDTKQDMSELEINMKHKRLIETCDEVHVLYQSESSGIHFDLGMAFMAGKPIRVIGDIKETDEKSYANFLNTLQEMNNTWLR